MTNEPSPPTTREMNPGFLGGPPSLFEAAGRDQLIVLLQSGLAPASTVLDIGCGVLRGGRWIIPLLDEGHYCGIEPQKGMVERGLAEFVSPEIAKIKRPKFDHNDRFDFSVFETRFTHFLARSIWTHASKSQIEAMLTAVGDWGTEESILLASFLPASSLASLARPARVVLRRLGYGPLRPDYAGDRWVGRSHESSEPGMIAHRYDWIEEAAARHGLKAERVPRAPLTPHGQVWTILRRAPVAGARI